MCGVGFFGDNGSLKGKALATSCITRRFSSGTPFPKKVMTSYLNIGGNENDNSFAIAIIRVSNCG